MRGLTLLEVIIAMFIFLVGIVGILAAMPTGINSAEWVIFQDCAIHLSRSKFAEFRRDRIDPDPSLGDLKPTPGGYLPTTGAYTPGKQEPYNTLDGDPWRDFASAPGQTYQYYPDIDRYEWKVESVPVDAGAGAVPSAPANYFFPVSSPNPTALNLFQVSISIRMKGTTREMRFSQYMMAYGQL
jgi:hypothetical protein